MADQLCTDTQVKGRLGITDATDDALILELIEGVSDWIQDYTGRRLVPEAAGNYTIDTVAGSVIRVPIGVRTVTLLEVASSDQPDSGGSYSAIAAADILLRPAAMDRRPGWPATEIWIRGTTGRLSTALNGAHVTGAFGFAAVPLRIREVAIDAVVSAYTTRRAGASGQIGADDLPAVPWASFFSKGSPQRATVDRFRIGQGIG